jgi:hypothetical protein
LDSFIPALTTSNEIANRADLSPSRDIRTGWTCDKETEPGDLVLLYCTSRGRDIKKSHKSAFCYLIQTKTKAYDGGAKWQHWRDEGWKWACDYQVLYEFENPVRFKDLKQRDSEFKEWEAYKRNNFQGMCFSVPEDTWDKLDQMASEKNPGYTGYRTPIEMPLLSIEATVEADLDSLFAEEELFEGKRGRRFTTYYERKPKLRSEAIRVHGTSAP